MLYGTLAPTGVGSADIHPLGYYTFLWLWIKAFGESFVAVRLLSISAGLVSVTLVYLMKGLDTSLQQRMEPQDVIVHSNKLSMLPAMIFDHNLPQSFIGDQPGSRTDTLASNAQQVLRIKADSDIQSATRNAERVWFIIYQRSIEEYEANGFPIHPDIKYLDAEYDLKSEENWDGLRVFLYSKNPYHCEQT